MKTNPIVSIIMPCKNGMPFLEQAINSILNQSFQNWELIFINDGSTDGTKNFITKLAKYNEKIIVLNNNKSIGVAKSRNLGIKVSRGEYIAFLDSDDIWYKTKLTEQISFIKEHNISFLATPYDYIDENNQIIGSFYPIKDKMNLNDILKHCDIGLLTSIYKKENFKKFQFLDTIKAEDYTLWIQILKHEEYVYVYPKVTAQYRIRKDSRASNKWIVGKAIWGIYKDVANLNLMLRIYYFSHFFIFFLKRKLKLKFGFL